MPKEGDIIEKIYVEQEEIDSIISKLKEYSFDDCIKSPHYDLSILSKGTNEDELREIYPRFKLVKLITLRKHKGGYENYDIHYELEKGNYALFAIHIEEGKKPKIDNAFIANKIFRNFLRTVVKKYGRDMI
jgi:hypothetical protein